MSISPAGVTSPATSSSVSASALTPPCFRPITIARAGPSYTNADRTSRSNTGRGEQREQISVVEGSQQRRQRGPSARGKSSLQAPHNSPPAAPQQAQRGGSAQSSACPAARKIDGYTEDMRLTVQLFASLAETCGARRLELDGLPDPLTAAAVADAVIARFPQLDGMRDSIMFAVNAEYVHADHPVCANDEVALIPPVSGGSADEPYFQITRDVLDPTALHNLVLRPEAGAVSLFLGVVRDNNLGREVDYLEYDAYPAMAVRVMRQIADEIRDRWDVLEIAMHHRIGRLQIGEASVAVAVSSAHRAEGIDACHYGIDRLKAIVPIWKKEVWADGEEWIEGSLTPAAEIEPPSG